MLEPRWTDRFQASCDSFLYRSSRFHYRVERCISLHSCWCTPVRWGQWTKDTSTLTIQSDSGGSPSANVVATGVIGNYVTEGTVSDAGGINYTTNRIPVQGYFGASGITLQSNTKYWLVLTYSDTTRVDFERCGAPDPASYGTVKISSDGSTWASGNVGYFPKIFMFR